MANINIISPRVGFVRLDDKTGEYVLTRDGFQLLRDIFNRIGGIDGISNDDIQMLIGFGDEANISIAEYSKELKASQVEQPTDHSAQFAELFKSIDNIRTEMQQQSSAEIAELKKQIADLQQQITLIPDSTFAVSEINKNKANTNGNSANAFAAAALTATSINGVTTDSTTNKPVTAASLAGGALPASVSGFGCNGASPQTAFVSGGTAPAGGVGTAAGGWDTAGHRDSAIALLNNIRSALVANGIMS